MRVVVGLNLLALVFLLWSADWLVNREPPWLTYEQLPFPLVRPDEPVYAGGAVPLFVTRCSTATTARSYSLSHTLINLDTNERTILPAGSASIEPGCRAVNSTANILDTSTKPGNYLLEGYAEVNGRVRTTAVHWYSVPFVVSARTKP